MIGFLLFQAFPLVSSFWLGFHRYDPAGAPDWIGLGNYAYLLRSDPVFWPAVRVTLIYACVVVPVGLLVSLGLALLLDYQGRSAAVFRGIFFLPALLPAAASGVLWVFIFDTHYGLLNRLIVAAGGEAVAWTQSSGTALLVVMVTGLWGFGGGMLVFLAGLQGVPRHLMESAVLDGAGVFQRLLHVTLPALRHYMLFNVVMALIGAFKVFDAAFVFGVSSGAGLGGPGRATFFYALAIYQRVFSYFHWGLASAMAWLLALVVLALSVVAWRLLRRAYD